MSKGLVDSSSLADIAVAIRARGGTSAMLKASEMAAAIQALPAGEAVLEPVTITENGTTTPPTGVDGFSSVVTNVSNSFSASDEGKVVSSGALVAQTSTTITQNGTVDTTLNNEVVVNVSGGGGSGTTVLTGTGEPTSDLGSPGDIYVKIAYEVLYTLTITQALRGSSSLTYAGAARIDMIFDDGNGNEVSLYDLSFSYSAFSTGGNAGGTPRNAFDNDTSTYWEAYNTPLGLAIKVSLPSGYALKQLKVIQRSSSYTSDVWKEFTLNNGTEDIITRSNLSTSDWAGANNWTTFNVDKNDNPASKTVVGSIYVKDASFGWLKTKDVLERFAIATLGYDHMVPMITYLEHSNYYIASGNEGYTIGGQNIFTVAAYNIDVGSSYVLTLGNQHGTRFRVAMLNNMPFVTVPSSGSGDTTIQQGTNVFETNSPSNYQCVAFKATAPYLGIYLSNADEQVNCYLYKIA